MAEIRQLSAYEVAALIESQPAMEKVDVRTEQEQEIAAIAGFRLLDQKYHDELMLLDRDTPMLFQCHHGIRSQQAALYFRQQGFTTLYNLQGGIDEWSVLIDSSVPRY
jgi:monothiol glutaredoxin